MYPLYTKSGYITTRYHKHLYKLLYAHLKILGPHRHYITVPKGSTEPQDNKGNGEGVEGIRYQTTLYGRLSVV